VGQAIADKHPKLKKFTSSETSILNYINDQMLYLWSWGKSLNSKGFWGAPRLYHDFDVRNFVIYGGPRGDVRKSCYTSMHGDHFDVINPAKLPTIHGKRFLCDKCKSFYQNYFTHPCSDPCNTCLRKDCLWLSDEKRSYATTVLNFVIQLYVSINTKNLPSKCESSPISITSQYFPHTRLCFLRSG
jgi:hypothetical protein